MRGFVFTIDSFVALTLALFVISALLLISSSTKSAAPSYFRLALMADDSMAALSEASLGALGSSANPISEKESALQGIGRLVSRGESVKAKEVAEKALSPLIPPQFGISLEYENADGAWETIYSRNGYGTGPQSLKASSVRIVSGEKTLGGAAGPACFNEGCPFCKGLPQGSVESEGFGPVPIRASVWVP